MSNLVKGSTQRNPLLEWMRRVTTDPDKEKPCSAIALVRSTHNVEEEVHSVRLTASQKWTVEELASRFFEIAKEDAKDIQGVSHEYVCHAFYGSDVPEAHKHFSLNPYGTETQFLNEAPDERGAKAQGMRLLETLAQGCFTLIRHTSGQIASENAQLRQENREMFNQLKEVVIKLTEVSNDHEMKRLQFARDSKEREMWIGFAPGLVNQILGREVFPQSTADTQMINAIAENLEEKDIEKLMGVAQGLPPIVWGPLAMRMQKKLEEKRKGESGIARVISIATANKDPESDAAGD